MKFRNLMLATVAATMPLPLSAIQPTPQDKSVAPVITPTAAPDEKPLDPAYYGLFEQLYGQVDQNALIDRSVTATTAMMKQQSPQLVTLFRSDAQLETRIAAVIKAAVVQQQKDVFPTQREETATLIASHMSPADARAWATFYASPLGKKALAVETANMQPKSAIESYVKNGEVTSAGVAADMRRAKAATVRDMNSKMTVAEQRQMIAFMRTPAFPKMAPVARELPAMRARLENIPMDPAAQAKAQADIAELILDAREAAEKKPK